MVIQVVRYIVSPGQELEFEEAWRQASKPLARSTHCLGYSLTRATTERNRYLLMVYWDTPDGHRFAFQQSADFEEVRRLIDPFAAGVEEDAHYRKTGVELVKHQLVRISGPPDGVGR